ncbi:hypothetical protein MRB53_002798 [Persea americana]|uniref:Uncharacterized protein n=1 Tax=Persea americana TaxID=3435 RepID=A0ACC2MWG4_PERAE|nr:hypothetical protein MRB53_002798 [Persea americana]
MDDMFVKLEGIAEDVGQVLSEHIRKTHQKKVPETESVLCLHKYSHKKLEEGNSSFEMQVEKDDQECCTSHALSLHLCCEDLQFRICSQKASVSFNVVAGAIVITVGEQLQEWSHGDLEFVIGEPVFEPGIDADPSFTLEFMCSPPSLNHKLSHVTKTISLVDQMLIALITLFLYSILTYISSKLAKT